MKLEAPYDIEAYLEKTQSLSCLDQDQDILKFIENQKEQQHSDQSLMHLLDGEQAFYRKQFKAALKHYLDAKGIANYEFFCFRASAYVSEEMNNYLKAIQFAKKALKVRPDDHPTLTLLARTYSEIDQRDKAQTIKQKLDDITGGKQAKAISSEEPEETPHYIPVGEQELEELSQIFATKEPEQANLFVNETEDHNKHSYEKDTTPEPEKPWESNSVVLPAGCDIFSHSPTPRESEESLTKRLYKTQDTSLPSLTQTTQQILTHQNQLEDYHQLYRRKTSNQTNFLFSCKSPESGSLTYPIQNLYTFPQKGYLINWQGHGVAINPGRGFLNNLHHHSLFLQDIQTVIVTEATPDSLEELYTIFNLSKKLSKQHLTTPITFYVNPNLYEVLKQRWPEHQSVYSLIGEWNIHESIHCTTCFYNDSICGVSIKCKDNNKEISISYYSGIPKNQTVCDLLIMDTKHASAEHVLALNPQITILYDSTGLTSYEQLRQIRNLQNYVVGSNRIIPTTNHLNIQLDSLTIKTEDGKAGHDLTELYAVATSPSTIEFVEKEATVKY